MYTWLIISYWKTIKDSTGIAIGKINLLKKAILARLARTFRGELGTNDPNDENAIELLKKIIWVPIKS